MQFLRSLYKWHRLCSSLHLGLKLCVCAGNPSTPTTQNTAFAPSHRHGIITSKILHIHEHIASEFSLNQYLLKIINNYYWQCSYKSEALTPQGRLSDPNKSMLSAMTKIKKTNGTEKKLDEALHGKGCQPVMPLLRKEHLNSKLADEDLVIKKRVFQDTRVGAHISPKSIRAVLLKERKMCNHSQ